ncbi:MAG: GNAT family N-acetyltransferase [Oscillospiraceae bacterium]|nr:GNAT family N-acetyltransferase [Oscillospiraceae bacterium]
MAKDTRERILDAALTLFSENGYAGTNIRELTASLGLVKSSMYRHFKSKQEIWDSLLDEMIAYYESRFGSPEHLPPVPDSAEGLIAMTMRMVKLTVYDEKIIRTRKVLSIEQYRDERARMLASRYFLTGLTGIFAPVFQEMMDRGLLRRDDPEMLAFAYTAPISSLIHLCDREPEKAEEALSQIEAFSRHFMRTYGLQNPDRGRNITIRALEKQEIPSALALAWQVFCRFESPVYGDEGTESFRKTLQDEVYLAGIRYYGAFDGTRLVGMLGIREAKCHICFFFVDGDYQRRGIGTGLFLRLLEDYPEQVITLNAAPYGLPFYHALGFTAADQEQTVSGIRFTPMQYCPKKEGNGFGNRTAHP